MFGFLDYWDEFNKSTASPNTCLLGTKYWVKHPTQNERHGAQFSKIHVPVVFVEHIIVGHIMLHNFVQLYELKYVRK